MQCNEIMKKDVAKIGLSDTARTAAELMSNRNLGFLPVTDEQGKVVGTITDRDLAVRVLAAGLEPSTSIDSVMTKEIVTCEPNDDIEKAQQQMEHYQKSRIIVCDENGSLRGVISLSDFATVASAQRFGDTVRRVSAREVRPS
jgi:CBS domain-containing protein